MNPEGPPLDISYGGQPAKQVSVSRKRIRKVCKTLLIPWRFARWLFRPPQQVGEQSKYRKRPTGLSINPFELCVVCGLIGYLIVRFAKVLI